MTGPFFFFNPPIPLPLDKSQYREISSLELQNTGTSAGCPTHMWSLLETQNPRNCLRPCQSESEYVSLYVRSWIGNFYTQSWELMLNKEMVPKCSCTEITVGRGGALKQVHAWVSLHCLRIRIVYASQVILILNQKDTLMRNQKNVISYVFFKYIIWKLKV